MKIAAFFDIDGTLVRCQSQQELMRLFVEKKKISFLRIFKLACWFSLYKFGLVGGGTARLRRETYPLFCNQPVDEIDKEILEAYQRFVRPSLNGEVCERVQWHQANGHYVVAISGTLLPFCKHICDELNIGEYYGTQLVVENGHYKPVWYGNILEGSAKSLFVQELAKRKNIDLSQSYAYADNYSDVSFLKAVRYPVVVNPDIRLRFFASHYNWEILKNGS